MDHSLLLPPSSLLPSLGICANSVFSSTFIFIFFLIIQDWLPYLYPKARKAIQVLCAIYSKVESTLYIWNGQLPWQHFLSAGLWQAHPIYCGALHYHFLPDAKRALLECICQPFTFWDITLQLASFGTSRVTPLPGSAASACTIPTCPQAPHSEMKRNYYFWSSSHLYRLLTSLPQNE